MFLTGNALNQKNDNRFLGCDNKENYEKNFKENWWSRRWKDVDISYVLNSDGYRTKEFNEVDWDNAVVILGDSNTMGLGLPIEQVVCSVLEKEINRPVVNISVAGSSNMFITYNTVRLIENFKPYAVINMWSAPSRIMTFNNHIISHWAWRSHGTPGAQPLLESWSFSVKKLKAKRILTKSPTVYTSGDAAPEWLEEHNTTRQSDELKRACRVMCRDIRHLEYAPKFWNLNEWATEIPTPNNVFGTSRDCLHANGKFHKKWAEIIKEDFIKNDWLD